MVFIYLDFADGAFPEVFNTFVAVDVGVFHTADAGVPSDTILANHTF